MNRIELAKYIQDKFKVLSKEDMLYYSTYWYDEYEDTFFDAYSSLKELCFNINWIDCGVSKLVISFNDNPDYVFKIPFRGAIQINSEEENPSDFIDYSLDDLGVFYKHAGENINGYDNPRWNYCAVEDYLYKEAKKRNLNSAFAETVQIIDIHGIPVYASENIPIKFGVSQRKQSEKLFNELRKSVTNITRDEYSNMLNLIMANVITKQNEYTATKLCDFIRQFKISDLHSGNVHFDQNNNIRIIDYSSFGYEDI